MHPGQHVPDIATGVVSMHLDGARGAAGPSARQSRNKPLKQGPMPCRSHLLGAEAEQNRAGTQGLRGTMQQRCYIGLLLLPQPPTLRLHPPAEALVSGLLVEGHGVHELQAGTLVLPPQQLPAVAVDHPHPLQRLEEPLVHLLLVEGIDFIVGQLILLQELLHQCRPPLAGLQGLAQPAVLGQHVGALGLGRGQRAADLTATVRELFQMCIHRIQGGYDTIH
mmetsp:Transcript_4746/g.13653  ORF Transcript_4746/g.13653 Transcript_4746/m.13653 type:complete len:222 (+) Transcript_4746:373-1038(+)